MNFIYTFPILFMSIYCSVQPDEQFDILWTDQAEAEILTEEEHKVAFRDFLLEGVLWFIHAGAFVEIWLYYSVLIPSSCHKCNQSSAPLSSRDWTISNIFLLVRICEESVPSLHGGRQDRSQQPRVPEWPGHQGSALHQGRGRYSWSRLIHGGWWGIYSTIHITHCFNSSYYLLVRWTSRSSRLGWWTWSSAPGTWSWAASTTCR